ncbi:N-acetylglutamate synthase-like GNAT family acetyltransferase [Hoeflea halophila]|uniref:N-acetylglutamate synthase-like GNAT family acetyltransferase n=1 Tax=Hoeflea halophila TaxID=714899 RepID=A0A286I9V4_9HYPH|nr:GNAT family N-acetyltransferase [Hoeflea halophila]SOE16426.1 N-acetylglutamate synthase-like GNAT family acetyltransferase [Hoeflea halophila]
MMGLRRASAAERGRVEKFQRAAYARTEATVGAQAIPLEWDYGQILEQCEVWLDESGGALRGVLILRVLDEALFLESIATAPDAAGSGRGRVLLEATFQRARKLGKTRVGLIANGLNPALSWYRRMGFLIDREVEQPGRRVIHMSADVPEV